MGKVYPRIDTRLREFIEAQHLFFVATAPAGSGGHLNLSPKGLESLAVLGELEVAYLDFTGSGAETIAHLRENGRIILMFCSLEGPPKIVRLHGRGEVIEPGDSQFQAIRDELPEHEMPVRSVIPVAVERISDSCVYGVPRYGYEEDRTTLTDWAAAKGAGAIEAYQQAHNLHSIDGLPALRSPDKRD